MGSKKKPPYDAEFREGAVRIVVETGRPAGEVAEELGINPGTLHSWVSRWRRNGTTSSDRPVRPAAASGGGRVREAERAELERLRREMTEKNKRIRELEMERDVFKRCMALWVK
ncbi:transposase [[Kitasatospora] papulosa]|nr:transposase [Streptomyces sp. SID7815]MYT48921.1 transposase [Streptomyces sp. SID7815]